MAHSACHVEKLAPRGQWGAPEGDNPRLFLASTRFQQREREREKYGEKYQYENLGCPSTVYGSVFSHIFTSTGYYYFLNSLHRAMWALNVVSVAIPSFSREIEHFSICIVVLWDLLYSEYLFSSLTGLEGETRSRASRRTCGSCRSCPVCPHLPSSTFGSVLPCLRRSWTKLCVTLWRTAGEWDRPDTYLGVLYLHLLTLTGITPSHTKPLDFEVMKYRPSGCLTLT